MSADGRRTNVVDLDGIPDRFAARFEAADPEPAKPAHDLIKDWPVMPAEAEHGLAGEVARLATQDCEADPAAVLLTFLAYFGAACGQKDGQTPYIHIGETRHAPRLYAAVVGTSSRARKGTSKYPVQRLMDAAQALYASYPLVSPRECNYKDAYGSYSGNSLNSSITKKEEISPAGPNSDSSVTKKEEISPCPVSEGPLSSGEGIIYRLRDGSDEKDKNGELSDPGAADKRLIVVEGELGSVFKVMQRDGSIVSTVLRVAWDGGTIEPLTKNSRIRSSNPHLCIVGHITRDELRDLLTSVDLRNGLANRFLWCMARRTKLCSRPKPMEDAAVADLARRIADCLCHATAGPLKWTGEALERWDALYPEITSERPGGWGYATARAEAQVLRLAMIYALLDRRLVIETQHLESAHGVWRYCDASARFLFEDATGDPASTKILVALRDAGGELTLTQIHAIFGRNLPGERLAAALNTLQEHGRVASVECPSGGRPVQRWRLL